MGGKNQRNMPVAKESDWLKITVDEFYSQKKLAEAAVEQITDRDFFFILDPESNSIALVMKHVAGNLRSRWRDFLTTDGEKSDRNRDLEFVIQEGETRDSILNSWQEGWAFLLKTLQSLSGEDLDRRVCIRGEPHSVIQAVQRTLTHCANHVGQIVYLAKHLSGEDWHSLSIPKGRSEEFNQEMRRRWEK